MGSLRAPEDRAQELLAAVRDPAQRVRAAERYLREQREAREAAALAALRAGLTLREVAEAAGMGRATVHELAVAHGIRHQRGRRKTARHLIR